MKKQDVNTKKSRLIDVQITLIAILCFGYWMYEIYAIPIHKPDKQVTEVVDAKIDDEPNEAFGPFTIYKEPVAIQPEAPKVQPQSTPDIVEPVIDDTVVDNSDVTDNNPKSTSTTSVNITKGADKPSAVTTNSGSETTSSPAISYGRNAVDIFPVHPDCIKFSNNEDILECFEKKLQKLVRRRFDDDLGAEHGLTGRQTVRVYFEIDTEGNISNIKGLSKHKVLVEEAERVAKLLPKMTPARKKGKKVRMSYVLPITLDMQ